MILFYAAWFICTVVGIWRILVMCSKTGRVYNDDRFIIFLALTPFSLLLAPVLVLVESAFWLGGKWDKFTQSPGYVAWKIQRQIRKRRRGPVVRIVEHMHKKRLEKIEREKTLPEV